MSLLALQKRRVIDNIQKGYYVDNPKNRKLGRVGQQYGGKKETDNELVRGMKQINALMSQQTRGKNLRYKSLYDFVLKEGVQQKGRPLPKGYNYGAMKECYKNAFQLMTRDWENHIYHEGYAVKPDVLPFPIAHAWVTDKEGNVIDNTWRDTDENTQYYGVPFDPFYVMKHTTDKGMYGVIEYNTDIVEGKFKKYEPTRQTKKKGRGKH